MKQHCKEAISLALWAAATMPLLFSKEHLLGKVCEQYGTEVIAECMLEMGVK